MSKRAAKLVLRQRLLTAWQWIRPWGKWLLGLALVLIMIVQIRTYGGLEDWWEQLTEAAQAGAWWYLLIALLLVPLNWYLEGCKWYVLLRPWWPSLSFSRVMKAVLAGIAVSLATPNRIGEYGGRALLFPLERAADVVLSSLLGSWCQWVVFVGLGWPALVYQLREWLQWSPAGSLILATSAPLFLLLLVGGVHWIWPYLLRFLQARRRKEKRGWRWLRMKLYRLTHLDRWVFYQALGVALLRFLTYSTQYLLLLWFFGLSLSIKEGLSGIFSIYLIQAGIPLPPGLGVMTRSELAMMIWTGVELHPLSIVSATFTLYVFNLLLPALPGIWLIVRHKKQSKLTET